MIYIKMTMTYIRMICIILQLTTTIGAPIYLPNSHPSCRNQPLLM